MSWCPCHVGVKTSNKASPSLLDRKFRVFLLTRLFLVRSANEGPANKFHNAFVQTYGMVSR